MGAGAQEVYRCGSTYSQKPCPNAVVVDVEDTRTSAQKAESDAKTRREMAQANAMEKSRQKEEALARAAQAKRDAAQRKQSRAKADMADRANGADAAPKPKNKGKKSASRKLPQEPQVFVASGPPASKPKAGSGSQQGK